MSNKITPDITFATSILGDRIYAIDQSGTSYDVSVEVAALIHRFIDTKEKGLFNRLNDKCNPEDIFPIYRLAAWAENNGYKKNDSYNASF